MKAKWQITIIYFVLLLVVAGWFYYQYQKPRANVATIKASYSLTAQNLYNEFVFNEAAADQKYTGKVIEVKGIVSEVQKADSSVMVLLAADNNTGGINCSMIYNDGLFPEEGVIVVVKGRCTGFLMDVNLVDAVLVKE